MPRAVPAYKCGRCGTLTLREDMTRLRVRLSGRVNGEYFLDLCAGCGDREEQEHDLKPLTKRPIRDLPPSPAPGSNE